MAKNQQKEKIGRPNFWDSLSEFRRPLAELFAAVAFRKKLIDLVPHGNGEPVLVLPGFGGNDATSKELRGFLRKIGYYAHAWRNGTNVGPNEKTIEHLKDKLDELHKKHGKKVTLIGHSLGGIFARELAREFPDKVERVITLASPFGSGHHPESVVLGTRTVFKILNPDAALLDDEKAHDRLLTPPPVPTTSIYTRNDGVVNWKTCINPKTPESENIEVFASHVGIIANPITFLIIADRLAQDSENWQGFDRSKYPSYIFRKDEKHESFTPENPDHDPSGGPKMF